MRLRKPNPEVVMREYACGYCGAAPKEFCVTKRGERSAWSHADRFRQAVQDQRISYDDVDPVAEPT